MKIDYLHIRSRFKNLEDVRIDFDEERLMTVIVGQNGSGKSNVLEALVSIFRNLDLGEKALFSYVIRYKLGEGNEEVNVEIDADPARGTVAKQYQTIAKFHGSGELLKLEKTIPFSKVKRDKKTGEAPYLPRHLFAYYSGPSDRLENYFRDHRTTFYKKLLKNKVDLKGDIRPLFYAKPFHSQFVLLAFFLNNEDSDERVFLKKHLGIVDLDSVHFVMKKPEWMKIKNKEELFWGADGVVREFLDLLFPHTLAPMKITRQEKDAKLTGKGKPKEFSHLFLPNLEKLREFSQGIEPDIFFKMLESTLLSEIISEVRVRVKVTSSEEPLSFNELSEGEQQLLTVLGLLKFTGTKDSLFLLDEPDTHLNPSWAVNYLSFLKDFVPNQKLSHLLMVTHHPLAIAELEKNQVQVMKMDENRHVTADKPMESPRGMGINGILRSDMFGLPSTLDNNTLKKLEKRNNWLAKKANNELTDIEENELKELNAHLDNLGFSLEYRDPLYRTFIEKMYKIRSLSLDEILTDEEKEQQEALASEIIKELVKHESTEELSELAKELSIQLKGE